uniref:Fibronectin type-III domain-containing protein n=1 Tax=Amphimedon queenslandica TaxID=400682 RepID=A0A1X7TR21_AMPQE
MRELGNLRCSYLSDHLHHNKEGKKKESDKAKDSQICIKYKIPVNCVIQSLMVERVSSFKHWENILHFDTTSRYTITFTKSKLFQPVTVTFRGGIMAIRIYWSLVLAECLSLVASMPSVVQFTQTAPTYSIVCPGDKLVLTCILTGTGGAAIWHGDKGTVELLRPDGSLNDTVDSFFVNINESNSTTVISTAINDSVPVTLDGANVDCAADGSTLIRFTIDVANAPASVSNISVNAINNSTMMISWTYQNDTEEHCLTGYAINISANDTFYVAINTPSNEYIPAQVVNISWDQISNDSITIWWNNNEDSTTPVPPIQYYIINVYSTSNNIIFNSNTANAIITITGLPLTDTNYTVTIIPVNVIGYGPSATVNVNVAIAPTMTSSYVPSSSSLVTLIKDISTGASSLLITSMSISVPTATGTLTISVTGGASVVTSSTMIPRPSTSISGSSVVPIVSGAVGTFLMHIDVLMLCRKYSTDGATPTYDEIIDKPTTTVPVPIYDTPMETDININVHTNTAYQRSTVNKDIIDVQNNAAYGQVTINSMVIIILMIMVLEH